MGQKFPLPAHQLRRVFVPVARQFKECGAAGDERRVYAELMRVNVAAFFQFRLAATFGFGGPPARALRKFRMLVRRKLQAGFDGMR